MSSVVLPVKEKWLLGFLFSFLLSVSPPPAATITHSQVSISLSPPRPGASPSTTPSRLVSEIKNVYSSFTAPTTPSRRVQSLAVAVPAVPPSSGRVIYFDRILNLSLRQELEFDLNDKSSVDVSPDNVLLPQQSL